MSHEFYPVEWIQAQKEKLLKLKEDTLNQMRHKSTEDLVIEPDQIVEDGDQAQKYLDQNVSFGLRAREIQKLRQIEMALSRIHQGTYGICEETDEPIGQSRLEKMPWATLSVEAAEEREKHLGMRSA
jgi:DnaK suppressor protein